MELSVPSSFPGFELMGDNVRPRLKKCGQGVRLFPLAKICKPEVIELGDCCRINDFVFIWPGVGVRVGKYSDLQPHVTIWGGGETIIGDYVSVAVGTVLLSAVYSHKEGLRMVDHLPEGHSNALYGKLVIENDAYIGANCTIMPNLTVGEGAVIGAHSFVNKDVEPWSICVGSPCKKIGERPRVSVSEKKDVEKEK
jgi:acetyltransferase-like isoleucine patch superfamily enzyme